jgi:alpha-galactosidase
MNYLSKIEDVSRLFSLYGSMAPPYGAISREGERLTYHGDGYVLSSHIKTHATGVMVREDEIQNISDHAISITSLLSKFSFYGGEYMVYTQYGQWCGESQGQWQPLVSEISNSNDDIRENVGASPFVALWNRQNHRGVAFHILCNSTWKFRIRRLYTKEVTLELGISDRDLQYTLQPGETLKLPQILHYEFRNQTDMDAYKLHRYCSDQYPAKRLPIIYNSWMSKFDTISFDLLSQQLQVAQTIGAEFFVIDAGWFGKAHEWFCSVGDWEESTDCSMCGRMAEFADKVRSCGLQFGLWFEIERAAANAKAPKAHPEHYLYEGGHYFVNFAKPETCDYIYDIVAKQIRKYNIAFIKFDFNAPLTFDPARHSFLDYFAGYRGFIRRLRAEFPNLYLENCAAGGGRMSLTNIPDFESFWMSDDQSLHRQIDIFKNTLVRMPVRALETWVTIASLCPFTPDANKDVSERTLMSGDGGWGYVESVTDGFLQACAVGGPLGISCDLTKFSPALTETMKTVVATYKAEREFWKVSECHILTDTETLLVLQFNDANFDTIKLYSYTKYSEQNAITVFPVCDAGGEYQMVDGSLLTADRLDKQGVDMAICNRHTANFLTLKKVPAFQQSETSAV